MLLKNWPKYIKLVVDQYNKSPKQKLGGLSPDSIHSEFDSILVNEAKKQNNISVFEEPHYQQQIINQKNYEKDSRNLQKGDYVYLSTDEKLFDKSYDVKVATI